MSLYMVTRCYGDTVSLTAEQIYERIVDSNKLPYNRNAFPARELVRICEMQDFPTKYALLIKCAILDFFANKEHIANCGGSRYIDEPGDPEAVQECYNSLYQVKDEEAISARRRYLTEMIAKASYLRIRNSLYHPGPTQKKLREDWIESKVQEYISKEEINFEKLIKDLHNEFVELIKKEEKKGSFDEDDKAEMQFWKSFYKSLEEVEDSIRR